MLFSGLLFAALGALASFDGPDFGDDLWPVIGIALASSGLIVLGWRVSRASQDRRELVVRAGRLVDAFQQYRSEVLTGVRTADMKGIIDAAAQVQPVIDELRACSEAAMATELSRAVHQARGVSYTVGVASEVGRSE